MPRPDEGLIHAWLDGELEAEEAARVEKLVAEDPEWAAAAAEARGLVAASSRILNALDVVAGDVIPKGGSAAPGMPRVAPEIVPNIASRIAPRAAPRRRVPAWMKLAAGIALIAGIGYVALDGNGLTVSRDAGAPTELVVLPKASDSVAGATATIAEPSFAAATPAAASPAVSSSAAANAQGTGAVSASPRVAEAESADRDAARPMAPSVTPSAAAAPPPAPMSAPTASAEALTRQAPPDTQALRRRMADARLEGVVVTGATVGAAAAIPERQSARSLQPQAAKSAAAAMAPAVEQRADAPAPLPIIEGCFRVTTRARIDSLLRDPRILATVADSIKLEIPSASYAWVRRAANGALVGRVWWTRGTANWRADPIECS